MCPFGHTVPHHSNLLPSLHLSPAPHAHTHTHTENMCHTHTPACPPYQSHHLCELTRSNTQSWSFMQTESLLKAQTHRPNTVAERLQVYKPLLFIDLCLLHEPLYKIIIYCLIVFLCVFHSLSVIPANWLLHPCKDIRYILLLKCVTILKHA